MAAEVLSDIPGGAELLEWFGGRTPSFHDAEVLWLSLDREGACAVLKVHGFEMTSDVDNRGYFVCTRHAVVTFTLMHVTAMELSGFNRQNALMGLSISSVETGGFRLELDPAYGLGGYVDALQVSISIEPGIPSGSQYLKLAAGS